MTIDEVRDVLRKSAADKAAEHALVTRVVAEFLLDSTDGYERQYGPPDAPNEVVASWLEAFAEVVSDLRERLLGKSGSSRRDDPDFDHWGEEPRYPVADWRYEVYNGDTRLGYWDWVESQTVFEGESPNGDSPQEEDDVD